MPTIAEASIDIAANVARLRADLAKGQNEVRKFQGGVERSFRTMRNVIGSLGIGLSIGALTQFGRHIIATAGQIGDMAEQLRIGTDELQSLNLAARRAGVGAEAMQAGISRLNESIGEAGGGNQAMIKSFNDLGVAFATADGKARSNTDVLGDLARAYAEAGDKTQFLSDLTDVMGRNAGRLAPILEQLGDGWGEFTRGAKNAGQVLDESTIATLDELGDAFETLHIQMQNFWAPFLAETAKVFGIIDRPLTERFGILNEEIQDLKATIDQFKSDPATADLPARFAAETELAVLEAERQKIIALRATQAQRSAPTVVSEVGGGDSGGGSRADAARQTEAQASALSELIADMERENELLHMTARERAVETAVREAHTAAMSEGNLLLDAEIERIRELAGANYDLANAQGTAAAASEELNSAASDAARQTESLIEDAKQEGEELGRGLSDLAFGFQTLEEFGVSALQSIINKLLELEFQFEGGSGGIADLLTGLLLGAFGGFSGASSIGAPTRFGGVFAEGGTLGAGKFGIAGEAGPELISGPATITPMGGMGGSTYFIDARGADATGMRRLERMIERLNGSIEPRAVSAVATARQRGGGFGRMFDK